MLILSQLIYIPRFLLSLAISLIAPSGKSKNHRREPIVIQEKNMDFVEEGPRKQVSDKTAAVRP